MESPVLPPKDRSFQHVQENEVDVLIVGAGLPGLRAAVDVHRTGFSVLVLEATESIGGKTCSVPASDSHPREWGIFDTPTIMSEAGNRGVYKLAENYGLNPVGMAGGRRESESSEGSITPTSNSQAPHREGEGTRYFSLEELIEEAEQAETEEGQPRVWTNAATSESGSRVPADPSSSTSVIVQEPQTQGDTDTQRAATALALNLPAGAIRLCSPVRLIMHSSPDASVTVHAGVGTGTRYRANRVVVSMPHARRSPLLHK